MKNRKFIKKIIFSILLLLCVCVPFLVHKNNVKAETNITDLTGTTWTFNSNIELPNEAYDIDFNSNGVIFSSLSTLEVAPDVYALIYLTGFGDNIIEVYTTSWVNDNYRTINITGGFDDINPNLINYLNNNATLVGGGTPEPDPVYTISGQYQFNKEITWLYDTSEQEGVLYLPFYVYNHANSSRVNYDYMVNQYDAIGDNYLMYANETASGTFSGQYAGAFTTSTTVRMLAGEETVYFYTAEVSELVYNWLNENGEFINDPTLDPNNPENPDSGNNPNNPNNPDFGTDTVRQIVNQVNAFLGIQILPALSFRDILLICIALPLLIYILKVFLGG